jgi:hypothetical protein
MAPARQKQTDIQRVETSLLIWLDGSIEETFSDFKNMRMQLRRVANSIDTFNTEEACIQFIKEQIKEKVNVVVSDSLGPIFVPRIHNMSQVNAIFIFCNNNNCEEDWVRIWPKITVCSQTLDHSVKHSGKQQRHANRIVCRSAWLRQQVTLRRTLIN